MSQLKKHILSSHFSLVWLLFYLLQNLFHKIQSLGSAASSILYKIIVKLDDFTASMYIL